MEWLLTAATALAFLALFAATEAIRRRGLSAEATRRFAHIAGASATALFPLYLALRDVLVLSVIFTALLTLTWERHALRSIHGVRRPTFGALLFPAGLAGAALVSWPHPSAFAFGALTLALADPAAATVGEHWRVRTWRVQGGRKSLAGAGAFFVVTSALAVLFSVATGRVLPVPILITAVLLTVVEGVLGYGLDNFPLPIIAALCGETLLHL